MGRQNNTLNVRGAPRDSGCSHQEIAMNSVRARLRLFACALLIALPAISHAQRLTITLPTVTTPTPQLVSPASNATINGAAPSGTNATFVWRESGLFSSPTI